MTIYETITTRILNQLAAGVVPWRKAMPGAAGRRLRVSGGAKVVENRRFENPVARQRLFSCRDALHGLSWSFIR